MTKYLFFFPPKYQQKSPFKGCSIKFTLDRMGGHVIDMNDNDTRVQVTVTDLFQVKLSFDWDQIVRYSSGFEMRLNNWFSDETGIFNELNGETYFEARVHL